MVLTLVAMLLASGAAAGGAAAFYFSLHVPAAAKFKLHYPFQDAHIYDSAGDLLYTLADLRKNSGGSRVVEPLQALHDTGNACRGGKNRIPLLLQNATIATEDATFYKNPGFDPLSIARAAYDDMSTGRIVSGASTITQQLVRAQVLNDKRTLSRKAEEIELAYEISKRFPKRKLLWYYLNDVPYGNLAYGAEAASETYFHEPVCRLDFAQAALLAGLPEAPSAYDPIHNRTGALHRMATVLHLLRVHGYIHSYAPVHAAKLEAQRWTFTPPANPMRYPAFVRYVLGQIQADPSLRRYLHRGIDVYTTLDPRLQDLAQRLVTQQIDGLAAQHVTDGALVSLDLRPQRYGWVLAMVGSAHYSGKAGQINMALRPRQPGSSMKPFNYIWAFTHGGVGPGTTVNDLPVVLPDPLDAEDNGWYTPSDYDHQFHGNVTLREALANSLNLPAVKVEYYVTGVHHVAQTAARFGMSSLYADNPGLDCTVCYAMTLGGLAHGTRLLEETSAYGVFASGGRTVPPVAIWKVVRRSTGKVLYCSAQCGLVRSSAPAPRRVLDPSHAAEMTDVLSDNSARCTVQVCEFGLDSPLALDRPAAAKTGTTNSWTDNWTVGYTPQIVTGVWVGNADRSAMINVIGVTGAAPIWHDFMEGAFGILKLPVVPFAEPGIVRTDQCRVPGSNTVSTGQMDVAVQGDPLPLCSIPERGTVPEQCPTYADGTSECGPMPPIASYVSPNTALTPNTVPGLSTPTTVQPGFNQGPYQPQSQSGTPP